MTSLAPDPDLFGQKLVRRESGRWTISNGGRALVEMLEKLDAARSSRDDPIGRLAAPPVGALTVFPRLFPRHNRPDDRTSVANRLAFLASSALGRPETLLEINFEDFVSELIRIRNGSRKNDGANSLCQKDDGQLAALSSDFSTIVTERLVQSTDPIFDSLREYFLDVVILMGRFSTKSRGRTTRCYLVAMLTGNIPSYDAIDAFDSAGLFIKLLESGVCRCCRKFIL